MRTNKIAILLIMVLKEVRAAMGILRESRQSKPSNSQQEQAQEQRKGRNVCWPTLGAGPHVWASIASARVPPKAVIEPIALLE